MPMQEKWGGGDAALQLIREPVLASRLGRFNLGRNRYPLINIHVTCTY